MLLHRQRAFFLAGGDLDLLGAVCFWCQLGKFCLIYKPHIRVSFWEGTLFPGKNRLFRVVSKALPLFRVVLRKFQNMRGGIWQKTLVQNFYLPPLDKFVLRTNGKSFLIITIMDVINQTGYKELWAGVNFIATPGNNGQHWFC